MAADRRDPARTPMPTTTSGLQAAFGQALLAGGAGPLAAALVSDRITAERRFAVHVNTFHSLLADVLEAAFPVVCQLVGTAFFRMAARAFVAGQPPTEPHLAVYGGGFADFLAGFPPAVSVPYLPCVARLEWARVEAYFAADATPLDPASLQALSPAVCPALVFTLHPSARLIRSPWPVVGLWRAHQRQPVAPVDLAAGGEVALVLRPDAVVEVFALGSGDAALIDAIAGGATLAAAAAAAAALEREPDFDLQATLAGHLSRGSFSGYVLAGSEAQNRNKDHECS